MPIQAVIKRPFWDLPLGWVGLSTEVVLAESERVIIIIIIIN